jgi:O-Antigen ligase
MALRAGELRYPVTSTGVALGVGVLAAATCVVLLQASLVWMALVVSGFLVLIGAFLIRDAKKYWLAVFVFSIPINITKLFFFTPAGVADLRMRYDLHQIDVLVPLLYLADLPLLVLLLEWLSEVFLRRSRFRFPKPLVLSLAFIVWCLGTLLQARAPELGLTWIFYQLKVSLVFLWFYNAALDKGVLRTVVATLALSVAIQGATTLYAYHAQIGGANLLGKLLGLQTTQTIRGDPTRLAAEFIYENGGPLRGTGTVGIANDQAKYFVMCLPLVLISGLFASSKFWRPFYLLAFALGASGLYFTYSRGGMLSAIAALCTLPFFMTRAGLLSRKFFVTLVVLALLGAAAATPFLYGHLTTRPGFYDIRWQHIRYGTEMVLKRPFLGFGINNFNVSVSEYAYEGVFSKMPIHNHYLRVALETGLVGLCLYLSFFVWIAAEAYRSIRSHDVFLSTMAMGILASMIGIFVYWMDDLFYGAVIRAQWWLLLGLVLAVRRLTLSESQAGGTEG